MVSAPRKPSQRRVVACRAGRRTTSFDADLPAGLAASLAARQAAAAAVAVQPVAVAPPSEVASDASSSRASVAGFRKHRACVSGIEGDGPGGSEDASPREYPSGDTGGRRRSACGGPGAPMESAQPEPQCEPPPPGAQRKDRVVHAPPAAPSFGVSAAFLLSFLVEQGLSKESPVEEATTRSVALNLKKQMRDADTFGPQAKLLAEQTHYLTSGKLVGPAACHIAHAWDADFRDLVTCILEDADLEVNRHYYLDLFCSDLHESHHDPVSSTRQVVSGVKEVLLVLDSEGLALKRLWVLFEALLATAAGKLRVRGSPGGFGASESSIRTWEAHIDAVDWVLAEANRNADDRQIRNFALKAWELGGKGIDAMLAQMKKQIRAEVYGQILVAAADSGNVQGVRAALEVGANPEQKDSLGNTAAELAAFNGHKHIEEAIFEHRMRRRYHGNLSSFLRPEDMVQSFAAMAPFFAEYASEAQEATADDTDSGDEMVGHFMSGTAMAAMFHEVDAAR